MTDDQVDVPDPELPEDLAALAALEGVPDNLAVAKDYRSLEFLAELKGAVQRRWTADEEVKNLIRSWRLYIPRIVSTDDLGLSDRFEAVLHKGEGEPDIELHLDWEEFHRVKDEALSPERRQEGEESEGNAAKIFRSTAEFAVLEAITRVAATVATAEEVRDLATSIQMLKPSDLFGGWDPKVAADDDRDEDDTDDGDDPA